jgi:hypothetical protein
MRRPNISAQKKELPGKPRQFRLETIRLMEPAISE